VPVEDQIRQRITAGLSPSQLEIADESHLHAGHAGARPGGESHFRLTIVSAAFDGKSRVERQRLVYGLLKTEMEGQIHALALKTLTPEEAAA
jgi:BolA protein